MINTESVPAATAPREHHADFVELTALRSRRRSVSIREYIGDLSLASTNESIADAEQRDPEEEGEDPTEALAESAFAELDERKRCCGEDVEKYPFEITANILRLRKNGEKSLYVFLALLSWFGKDSGPPNQDGEKLFEEVCAQAAESYLGGPRSHVRSFLFGFPRRVEPTGFAAALDKLCCSMGEGQGHHKGRSKLPDQKDAKLDIVAWKEFEDRRQGKLITFGQCATGQNWDGKISELPQPDRWCGHWMADTPTVLPVRSFFVPHRVGLYNWSYVCTFGGILYDRCRITSLVSRDNLTLQRSWKRWSIHVLNRIRRK